MNMGNEFTTGLRREYSIQKWGGEYWLCYKHPDGQWVSLREAMECEVSAVMEAKAEGFRIALGRIRIIMPSTDYRDSLEKDIQTKISELEGKL